MLDLRYDLGSPTPTKSGFDQELTPLREVYRVNREDMHGPLLSDCPTGSSAASHY